MLREVREVEKKHELTESEHVLLQNAFPQDMERRPKPRGSSVVKEMEELFRSGRKESRHPRLRGRGPSGVILTSRGNERENVRRKARKRKWVFLPKQGEVSLLSHWTGPSGSGWQTSPKMRRTSLSTESEVASSCSCLVFMI